MPKYKKIPSTTGDQTLFQKAMKGVQPLQHTKTTLSPIRSPQLSRQIRITKYDEQPSFEFSDQENLPAVTGDTLLEFARSGVQHKKLRKLRQGQYNMDATLDLHGKTVVKARESLSQFLLECQKRGLRHVLIIHGKGRDINKPVLKNKLNHWLRQTEQVLAFVSAATKDGKSGALYVLLRR